MASNPVIHFEIGCTDTEATRSFFDGMFDWDIGGADQGFPISTGDPNGPTGHLVGLGAEWGHYVTVYVKVDALEPALEKASALGGKVLVEPIALPEQGRFAWIAAPEGQIIGLWETA